MLSRGEESCGDVGLNNGFSGFFMVGEDMSAGKKKKNRWDIRSLHKVLAQSNTSVRNEIWDEQNYTFSKINLKTKRKKSH